jgi:hypothetical protein
LRSWHWLSNPLTMSWTPGWRKPLQCCADHGGVPEAAGHADAYREGAAGQWRSAFIRIK